MSNLSILQNKSVKVSTVHLLQAINDIRVKNGEKEIRSNDFIARVADELEGENYESFVVENSNKTKTNYFIISIEQAKLVAMRESKIVRKAVRDRLTELESKNQFQIPQTLPEALRLAADLADQLAIAAPKVAVYELLADRKGDVSTTIVAKELGTTAIKLNRFLRDKGVKWLNADLPKAGYESWFNVVADVKNGHEFTQCLVTPDGQLKIAELWSKK
jgi:phage antirepressor YoqD-like protein